MTYQPPLAGMEDVFRSHFPTQLTELLQFPNVSPGLLKHHGKAIGRAGELLVESTFLRIGLQSVSLAEHLPFDCVVLHSRGLIRVQVKTSARPRDGSYHFNVLRGYHRSPAGVRQYAEGDFDLLALVALSDNVVKFSADRQRAQAIGLDEVDGLRRQPGASYEQALEDLGMDQAGSSEASPLPFCY
ncbi:MAG: group I intron-associated PD-(D/E)XK endonuclease [Sulfitobacter sp.]